MPIPLGMLMRMGEWYINCIKKAYVNAGNVGIIASYFHLNLAVSP